VIIGSDKTTVSVATGQTEYWPLYASVGNLHNNVRRAHGNGLVLIGFLAIPKSKRPESYFCMKMFTNMVDKATKAYNSCADFRQFRRQLFHASLATIFSSLKPGMSCPEVAKFPDGHFRRMIQGLGPYIADYPEQVLLSCIVQGWCAQ